MKKMIVSHLLAVILFTLVAEAAEDHWVEKTGARVFPSSKKVFLVNDYGAFRDRLIASTAAIQKAIDECAASGGGKVTFTPGVYHTGAIFLKDSVNLDIPDGVELRALIGLEYYPEIQTRVAGIEMMWPSGIINILNKKNVAVTGEGLIHAQGKYHWERYWNLREAYTPRGLRWASDYDCKRVRTIQVANSEDVTIRGIEIRQSGFWTVHILYSSFVTVDGLTVRNNIDGFGPSTDGVNVDSSTYVRISNCDVDCNDDNFTVKAGRDADGLRVNRPSEYVYIHDCIARRGGGVLVIGSETSGWIRHVRVENMRAIGTNHVLHLKSAFTRGGGIEHIEIRDVSASNIRTFCEVNLDWNPAYSYASLPEDITDIPAHWKVMLREVPREKGLAVIRHVKLENCRAEQSGTAFNVSGAEESPIRHFTLKNIHVEAGNAGRLTFAEEWTMDGVVIQTPGKRELDVKNSSKISMQKVVYQ